MKQIVFAGSCFACGSSSVLDVASDTIQNRHLLYLLYLLAGSDPPVAGTSRVLNRNPQLNQQNLSP